MTVPEETCPYHGGAPDPEGCPACAGDDWCYGHMRREESEGAFLRCGECLHVFREPGDLLELDNEVRQEVNPGAPLTESVDNVWVCPVCCHDL